MNASNLRSEVLLGYSGGVDSTVAAAKLSEQYHKLHLVTYMPGTLIFVGQSKKNANILIDKLGADRAEHHILDIRPLCGKFRRGFAKDYVTYCDGRAPAVFCMACKLGMHTRNIIYCLENGVPCAADGSVRTQSDHPEMMPRVINEIARLYAEYNIRFTTPVYDFGSKDEELEYLRKEGFHLGPKFGESDYRTIQAVCLLGPFYTVWHLREPNTQDQVVPYVRDKLAIARRAVMEYFAEQGKDVDALKARLPRVDAADIQHYESTGDGVKLMGVLGGRKDKILSNALRPLWWFLRGGLRLLARSGK